MARRAARAAQSAGVAFVVLAAAAVVPVAPAQGQAVEESSAAYARLQVRVATLEQDIRAATGQVEELDFRIRRLEERLETAIADMESRLERLEAAAQGAPVAAAPAAPRGPAPPPTAAPPPQAPAAAATLPDGTPEEQYAYAFRLLQTAQYDTAEAALRAFVDRHPEAELADNARYWLAETYYVRGNFEGAAKAFATAYQAKKDGSKAPDSLLKLGMSLAKIGRTDDACTTFAQLKRAFPRAPQRIEDRRAAEATRLGCP